MQKKIDHIGIAVKSLEEAAAFYREVLGLTCEKVETVESQGVRTAHYPIGDTRLELLEAISAESPIARFIEKHGEGLHHIAYACDDIDAQLRLAEKMGCRLLHEQPVAGAGGKLIAFLHPKSTFGVLTEFCTGED